MRRLAPLTLPALLVGAITLAGCGGDEDLTVAIAEDVRGAAIDAAADAAPRMGSESDSGSDPETTAPQVAVETAPVEDEPVAAAPAGEVPPDSGREDPAVPPPGADPDGVDPPGDTGEPVPAPEMLLGDVPTADDEVQPPAVEVPDGDDGAAAEFEDEPLDIPIPDEDDWQIEPPKPPVLVDGEWSTSFDYLGSFDVGLDALSADNPLAQHTPKMPLPEKVEGAPEPEKGIPDAVRAMDGKKVRIEGYMIPLKFEDGAVKTFFLSRYMMGCCFGVLPKANEVIEVQMVGEKGAYYDAYMPFVVVGTFEIVEEGTSPEFLQSVFRMKADACDYAEDW